MNSMGMLWFDNSPLSLAQKVNQALRYYKDKYGEPSICYVHRAMIDGSERDVDIEIKTADVLMPNHIWVGVVPEITP